MKDYSDWEPSSRLCWWVSYLKIIVWCCIIGYILLLVNVFPKNTETEGFNKTGGWMIMSSFLCVFCLGGMGGWYEDDERKKKEPDLSNSSLSLCSFLLVIVFFIFCLYTNCILPSIILICCVVVTGLFLGYKYSIPFYHYYRKNARFYIPKNMYWGKSQWQIDRMEERYALLQAWYPLRVIAIFSWIIMGWLILPFISFNPSK